MTSRKTETKCDWDTGNSLKPEVPLTLSRMCLDRFHYCKYVISSEPQQSRVYQKLYLLTKPDNVPSCVIKLPFIHFQAQLPSFCIISDEEINQLFLSWRHLSMNSQKHLSYAKLKKDREFYKALNWCFSPSVEIFFFVLCPDWSCSWHQLKAWWPFYPHIGFIWCHYFINNFRHLCGRQRKRTLLKTILGSRLLIIK